MSEYIYDEDGKITSKTLPNGTQVVKVVPIKREEIVRCRNCKHFHEDRRDTSIGWVSVFVCDSEQWSTSSLMPSHKVEPDGFCWKAERKVGE